jgi:HK97 family phage major capsid protein
MARNVLDGTGWLPEQRDSNVVKAFRRTSVVEAEFRTINMTANTVEIPRIEDMDVEFIAKGAAYPEDQSSADVISVTARKIGGVLRIAEEDVEDDQLADYVDEKKLSAGSSFAKKVDNAALGTSAAASGVTVPFTSVYRALTTADATTDYVANANHISLEAGDSATIDDVLSNALGLLEDGDYFDEDDLVWIANPRFRRLVRDKKDSTGRRIFLNDIVNGRAVPRLYDIPVRFTRGATVTTTPATKPTSGTGAKGTAGNALAFLIQKNAAVFGRRKAFESVYIPGRNGTAALTDEDLLKVRARIASGVTIPGAHAVIELVADA